jgi:hypothetical protein
MPPTLPLDRGLAGLCAHEKCTVFVNNVYEDVRFDRTIDMATGFMTKSVCCAPIVS